MGAQIHSESLIESTPKKTLGSMISQNQTATTVSQKRPAKTLYNFFED